MENNVWSILVALITWYIIYVFLLCFFITSFIYLTYRFWKIILPNEEINVFVTNAPVIGHEIKKYDN